MDVLGIKWHHLLQIQATRIRLLLLSRFFNYPSHEWKQMLHTCDSTNEHSRQRERTMLKDAERLNKNQKHKRESMKNICSPSTCICVSYLVCFASTSFLLSVNRLLSKSHSFLAKDRSQDTLTRLSETAADSSAVAVALKFKRHAVCVLELSCVGDWIIAARWLNWILIGCSWSGYVQWINAKSLYHSFPLLLDVQQQWVNSAPC